MRISESRRAVMESAILLYKSGKSLSEVSKEIDVPIPTISRWLKLSGTETRDIGNWHRGRKWTDARRAHHPEKPSRDPAAPSGYDILTDRALGNKSITKQGYVLVAVGRKKRRYEHRVIAEKALGRPLKKSEVVHHINCIRHDNRPENLLICTTGYHVQLHDRMRKDPYWSRVEQAAKSASEK